MVKLTTQWWKDPKHDYVFDRSWFKVFEKLDPRLKLPSTSYPLPGEDNTSAGIVFRQDMDGTVVPVGLTPPTNSRIGIVFWHEADGKTIVPVGIVARFGDENLFCYHPEYARNPRTAPISKTLPKDKLLYSNKDSDALLPFFDNLVSEGWLAEVQNEAYHKYHDQESFYTGYQQKHARPHDDGQERFNRLITFGTDLHGAVSVATAAFDHFWAQEDSTMHQALWARGSVPGVQAKMLGVAVGMSPDKTGMIFRPATHGDTSTLISKYSHTKYAGLVVNEYLSIMATQALLPKDTCVKANLGPSLAHDNEIALGIDRFDRTPQGGRMHFEEALQLIGSPARNKYAHSYRELNTLVRTYLGKAGAKQTYKRILVQWLLGNADGHWKNFALWQRSHGWELTPQYDLVATDQYKTLENRKPNGHGPSMTANYGTREVNQDNVLHLRIGGRRYKISDINPKLMFLLAQEFGLTLDEFKAAADEIRKQFPATVQALNAIKHAYVDEEYKADFIKDLTRRFEQQYGTLDRYYQIKKSRESGHTRGNR